LQEYNHHHNGQQQPQQLQKRLVHIPFFYALVICNSAASLWCLQRLMHVCVFVLPAVDVTADASKSCRELLTKLLEAGWEAKAYDSLAALLKPRSTTAAAAAAAAGGSGTAAAGALALAQQTTEMYHVVGGGDIVVGLRCNSSASAAVQAKGSYI
jgi:hypothetical protein